MLRSARITATNADLFNCHGLSRRRILGLRNPPSANRDELTSPAPKVFSAVRGLETFSTRFFLEWQDRAGAAHTLELTPAVYSRLRGPYNRRNVYGAVLAYGPVLLTDPRGRPMFDAVAVHALCGEAPLLRYRSGDLIAV